MPAAVLAPPLPPGAVIHGPGSAAVDGLLDAFAHEIAGRGFRVGGLVQRDAGIGARRAERMVLVDVASGESFDISQKLGPESSSCRVDPTGVAAASAAVRRAVEDRVDLLVVNKFAGLEAVGQGLAAELLTGIAAGIPVLTSVGGRYLREWQAFSGGQAELLAPDRAALWRWWGPHRLYDDLLLAIEDAPVRRVVTGLNWVAVETRRALGLAARPATAGSGASGGSEGSGSGGSEGGGAWSGQSLRALAERGLRSWDALETAVGIAAINAHLNHAGIAGPSGNGLDVFGAVDGPTVVVGAFPQIARRLAHTHVIEMRPGPDEFPEAACEWLIPAAGAALVTASSLANRSLPRLLRSARSGAQGGRLALVGPGTPLTPRLFDYGVEALCGFVAEDRDRVVEVIAAGGSSRDFHRFGRFVTLRRPD